MTPIDLLIFALGAGVGCCVGYIIGRITEARVTRTVYVTRTQDVFLPDLEEPDCVMPPEPAETDWEDFDQRTGLRGIERTYGLPPSGSKMGGYSY